MADDKSKTTEPVQPEEHDYDEKPDVTEDDADFDAEEQNAKEVSS